MCRGWSRTSSSPRSSGRGPARCATSSPPSSRSRTGSSGPELTDSLCIQGAPGTGKTAVGLHRAAYLLYAYREQLARSGVLVVGPNDSFLSYIGDVLPALGEIDATQATVSSLVAAATGADDPRARPGARGVDQGRRPDGRGAAPRRLGPRRPPDRSAGGAARGVPVAGRRLPRRGDRSTSSRQRGVRYEAGRTMLPQRLAHQVLVRMEAAGDSPDDRVQNAVARSKPVKTYADVLWPKVDPVKLVLRLLTDADFLATAAAGILTPEEQQLIMMIKPARSVASARWSLADVVLIDEAADLRQPDPQPGTRDPRRGAGPLAHAAARGRPPGQHRLGHRARRSGPGHHPLGDPLLGGVDDPPRPPRRRGRGARRRLPGAGRGDRLRRPAAAPHRPAADPAALGPPPPRRARSPAQPAVSRRR